MQEKFQESRVRRTVNDLVVAEMLLIQATIESAGAIGEGVNELGRHVTGNDDEDDGSIQDLLQRIADQAVEPYRSRFRYLRVLREDHD